MNERIQPAAFSQGLIYECFAALLTRQILGSNNSASTFCKYRVCNPLGNAGVISLSRAINPCVMNDNERTTLGKKPGVSCARVLAPHL